MLKKIILLTFSLFLSIITFGQNISIDYMVKINRIGGLTNVKSNYTLNINGNKSIYQNNMADSLNAFENKSMIKNIVGKGDVVVINMNDMAYAVYVHERFYKNYQTDTILYDSETVSYKKIIIVENLHLFNWTILPIKDTTILNYKCQTATADFRGRKYTAYFNQELNSFGGPWKFDGLPGLILAVHSHDNYLIIEPVKIALNTQKEAIKNPFEKIKKENINTFEIYKSKVKEKMLKILKKMKAMSENDEGGEVSPPDRIEKLEIESISFGNMKKK